MENHRYEELAKDLSKNRLCDLLCSPKILQKGVGVKRDSRLPLLAPLPQPDHLAHVAVGRQHVPHVTPKAVLASNGAYGWPGAAGTQFWVDPQEELIGLVLPQVRFLMAPVRAVFQNLVYQALVD